MFTTPFASEKRGTLCCICNGTVALENSKADEHGKAVHEDCYVRKTISRFRTASAAYIQTCDVVSSTLQKATFAQRPEQRIWVKRLLRHSLIIAHIKRVSAGCSFRTPKF